MSEYTTSDAVTMAHEGDAAGFRDAISSILMDKVVDAVEFKKHEVAATFMHQETEDE